MLGSEDFRTLVDGGTVIIAGGDLLGSEDCDLVREYALAIIAGGELLALASLAF